ncbi:MAG TPA: helix-turn-helix transcriptional regulator, partial [Chloroflexota bacterium]
LDLDVAAPAVEARIVDLDLQRLRFRHPLIRSAVAQSASVTNRRRVHEALASVLEDQNRRAWHRAALLTGEHEDVAQELEGAGAQALQRGALAVAVTAMRRAAELGQPPRRSRRLLDAAAVAVELGRPDAVMPLLAELNQLDLGDLERARVTWIEEMAVTRPLGDVGRITSLVAAAERAGAAGDHELHVDLLWLVASRAWWVDPGPAARQILIDASRRLGDATAEDPRVFAIHAYADPLGHAADVLDRLRTAACDERLTVDDTRFFGPAALVVGAFDLGHDFLAVAVDQLRAQGRLGHLPRLLTLYSTMAARMGDWEVAIGALASDLTRWPFQRARIQLAYGQWLRRTRRVAESRSLLRAGRDTFDALGCAAWSEYARRELRASGERSRRRVPEAREQLTPQELQIAQLAAEGLSNREIGQRLYLSHRTISTHLYRVFPKLGITSRAELSGALGPSPARRQCGRP